MGCATEASGGPAPTSPAQNQAPPDGGTASGRAPDPGDRPAPPEPKRAAPVLVDAKSGDARRDQDAGAGFRTPQRGSARRSKVRTAEAGEERRPLGPREGFEIFPAGLGCAAELVQSFHGHREDPTKSWAFGSRKNTTSMISVSDASFSYLVFRIGLSFLNKLLNSKCF